MRVVRWAVFATGITAVGMMNQCKTISDETPATTKAWRDVVEWKRCGDGWVYVECAVGWDGYVTEESIEVDEVCSVGPTSMTVTKPGGTYLGVLPADDGARPCFLPGGTSVDLNGPPGRPLDVFRTQWRVRLAKKIAGCTLEVGTILSSDVSFNYSGQHSVTPARPMIPETVSGAEPCVVGKSTPRPVLRFRQ